MFFRQYLTFLDGNEITYDTSIPRPSIEMEFAADDIQDMIEALTEEEFEEFDFSKIGSIDELGILEDEMLDVSEMYGIPTLKLLANYSLSIPDILYLNVGTSSRILRYNKRNIQDSDYLEQNIGNVGVLFATVKHLNSKSKLVPVINLVTNQAEFNVEEFFNMTDLMFTIQEINTVSAQV